MDKRAYIRQSDTFLKEEIAKIKRLENIFDDEDEPEEKQKEAEKYLADLKGRQSQVEEKLEVIKKSSGNQWENIKPDMDRMLQGLRHSINEVVSKLL